jgi:hypothetical protein
MTITKVINMTTETGIKIKILKILAKKCRILERYRKIKFIGEILNESIRWVALYNYSMSTSLKKWQLFIIAK